jgi:OHCU decarboxylase
MENLPHDLNWLNLLPPNEAAEELLKCCGSKHWASQLAAERPFTSAAELLAKATRIWWSLEPHDWLEAFRSHPKIGANKRRVSSESKKGDDDTSDTWPEQEQAGVRHAKQEIMDSLVELNSQYETKFGYIFIVCATGKSSEEMLAILQDRLENDASIELHIAAAEQAKITELRLKKLIVVNDKISSG